ncbi:MAG: CapA family protein, partial [Bacteroides sp.]|nr:CapA family protein [Bacteroides sp.]
MKTLVVFIALLYSVTLSAQERITLLFVGDLMQHQAQIDAARTPQGEYDYSACFSRVKQQISQADIAIANLEVTLGGAPYRGYPAFSAPDSYLTSILDAGFDVLLTANNHCLDRGRKGLERTISLLDSLSVPHAGTYRDAAERKQRYPLFLKKNGFTIALLNYTYGTNGIRVTAPNVVNYIDREAILQDIRSAQARRPDAIIACMHWGEEYRSLPNSEQRALADWLLAQGVTHVIGAHPHVIQPMELRTDGRRQHVVVYSLGNFISNMRATNTDGGLIFTLELEKYPLSSSPVPPPGFSRSTLLCDSASILYPYCRVTRCGYNLVWTLRPEFTPEKNFILLPVDAPSDSLPSVARNRLKIFTENSRNLLQK